MADNDGGINVRFEIPNPMDDLVDLPSKDAGVLSCSGQILAFAEIDDGDLDILDCDDQGFGRFRYGHSRPDGLDVILMEQFPGFGKDIDTIVENMIVSQGRHLERNPGKT